MNTRAMLKTPHQTISSILNNQHFSTFPCLPFLQSSIAPAAYGIVRKRISGINDSEAIAYRGISMDFYASKIVPEFIGVTECADGTYLELQDLLHGFKDPAVMDIKMGRRTFLESEVTNAMLRGDLYRKMIAVAPNEPTAEEHQQQAVTKLRYMLFREQMSSSESRGFRIEALRMKGAMPITDLKMVKTDLDVYKTIAQFLCGKQKLIKDLLRRLEEIRRFIEKSVYFQRHEIVGSSVFIVYDEERIGAWIIDFAKARPLPEHMHIDHRRTWIPGNCEEGLLYGIDEFIKIVQDVAADRSTMIAGKHCAKKVFGCPKARQ